MATGKQYGLIVPKKLSKISLIKKPSIFDDDDNDGIGERSQNVGETLQKEGFKAKLKKQTQLDMKKALEEDPTIYEYDSIYDDIEKKRKEKLVKEVVKEKKPRYIGALLKSAEARKREQERRIERKVQKEREAEGDEFADKEAFVTSAYKKKMLEQQEEEERERREEAIENLTDVTKQKDLSGFYRHLLRQKFGEETNSNSYSIEEKFGTKDKKHDVVPSSSRHANSVNETEMSSKPRSGLQTTKPSQSRIIRKRRRSSSSSSDNSTSDESAMQSSTSRKKTDNADSKIKRKQRTSTASDSSDSTQEQKTADKSYRNDRKQDPSSSSSDESHTKQEVKHKASSYDKSLHSTGKDDPRLIPKSQNNKDAVRPSHKIEDSEQESRKFNVDIQKAEEHKTEEKANQKHRSSSSAEEESNQVEKPVTNKNKDTTEESIKSDPKLKFRHVFARRNTGAKLEEAKQRYLERKAAREAAKVVVGPSV